MNKDINLGEAAVMVQRYKEIEKIEDKEEYIKALFKEAKSNYGFGNSNIELKIVPPEMLEGAIGGSDPAIHSVQIRRIFHVHVYLIRFTMNFVITNSIIWRLICHRKIICKQ